MSVKVERCIIKHKHNFRFSFSCTLHSILYTQNKAVNLKKNKMQDSE